MSHPGRTADPCILVQDKRLKDVTHITFISVCLWHEVEVYYVFCLNNHSDIVQI